LQNYLMRPAHVRRIFGVVGEIEFGSIADKSATAGADKSLVRRDSIN
jgi:hypothetical protein